MKIIIAGVGKVGSTLTRQLSASGYDITLIDVKQQVLEANVEKYDVMAVWEIVPLWRHCFRQV